MPIILSVMLLRFYKGIITVVFSALLSVFIIYPFLHELGHALALMSVKCKIVSFSVFPLPFVLCEGSMTDCQTAIVAVSGNLLPVAMLLLPVPKNMFFRSMIMMMGTVSIVFCVVSVVGTAVPLPYDDISIVSPEYLSLAVIVNLLCIFVAMFKILSLKFLNFLTNYLSEASVS